MKTIYLVRHGESENNATHRYNELESALSERGREQALQIASRCAHLPIETIVSSPIVRAKETAAILAHHLGKEIEFSDFFKERRLPASLQGAVKKDKKVVQVMAAMNDNFTVPSYRYEDGENFEDLKKRAFGGLHFLAERPEGHILVVSHGFFTIIIAAAVLFGESLTAEDCLHVMRGLQVMRNTSLTVLRYNDHGGDALEGMEAPWQLRIWNDHAHLG